MGNVHLSLKKKSNFITLIFRRAIGNIWRAYLGTFFELVPCESWLCEPCLRHEWGPVNNETDDFDEKLLRSNY